MTKFDNIHYDEMANSFERGGRKATGRKEKSLVAGLPEKVYIEIDFFFDLPPLLGGFLFY